MPRNISFALTTPQFLDGSKDVTRRMGWESIRAGDELIAREKVMGFKKGEKMPAPIGRIRVLSVRREPLNRMEHDVAYGREECRREGFPDMKATEFVEFFCRSHTGCFPERDVTRIEFERINVPVGGSRHD